MRIRLTAAPASARVWPKLGPMSNDLGKFRIGQIWSELEVEPTSTTIGARFRSQLAAGRCCTQTWTDLPANGGPNPQHEPERDASHRSRVVRGHRGAPSLSRQILFWAILLTPSVAEGIDDPPTRRSEARGHSVLAALSFVRVGAWSGMCVAYRRENSAQTPIEMRLKRLRTHTTTSGSAPGNLYRRPVEPKFGRLRADVGQMRARFD